MIDAKKTGLVLKDEESLAQMALTSDHELYQAMIRRALAMDVVGLATLATSQAWVERLFDTQSGHSRGFCESEPSAVAAS